MCWFVYHRDVPATEASYGARLGSSSDWLSPWPASVAQTVAATQMRGGLPKPEFTDADRQKAFDQIAVFFKQKLSRP